jgi:hypothetical protein
MRSRKCYRAGFVDGEVRVTSAWFESQGEARKQGWWGTLETALENLRDRTIEEIGAADRARTAADGRLARVREAIRKNVEATSGE